jgi:hypothetical protein
MAGLREESELAPVPRLIRGTAMNLIIAGILSMAFMGFAGLFSAACSRPRPLVGVLIKAKQPAGTVDCIVSCRYSYEPFCTDARLFGVDHGSRRR